MASVRDGLAFAGSRKAWRQQQDGPRDVAELTADIEVRYAQLKSLRDVAALLWQEAAARPFALVKLLSWKAIRPWYATDTRRHEVAIALLQIPYLALLAWSLGRAWRQGSKPARLASLLAASCFLFWAMAFVALSIVRYMVPVITILFAIVPAALPRRPGAASFGSAP